jgi:hypothetical protein
MSEHATPEDHHVEPAGLDPDEPNTPNWLTALGGALFLLVALFFLATAGDEPESAVGAPPNAETEHPAGDEPPSEE